MEVGVDVFRSGDGALLFLRRVSPARPWARAVLVHGAGVHSEYYLPQALALAEAGFDVTCPDLRGHGRSDGRAAPYDYRRLVADLRELVAAAAIRPGGLPVLLAGESYGGALAVLAAADPAVPARGLALSAPAFGLKVPPTRWQRRLVTWAARVAPGWRLPIRLTVAGTTHHRAGVWMAERDPMVYRRYPVGYVAALLAAQADAVAAAARLRLPTLVLLPGRDHVTDTACTRRVVAGAPGPVTVVEFPEDYHATFCEHPRRNAGRLAAWFRRVTGADGPEGDAHDGPA